MNDQTSYNVLFLCTGNSARSIMAECILNRVGRDKFTAYSAGSMPKGEIHPHAINTLKLNNFITGELRSKNWDEFAQPDSPKLDFVFTLCDSAAAETCPVWLGQPMTAHWGLPDPAVVEGTDPEKAIAFARAFGTLTNRIEIFVSLPISSLDKLALKARLQQIGST